MPEPDDVDIQDFETGTTSGIIKGIAHRLGHSYEYIRQRLRDLDKPSWYEQFYTFWLAVDAEDQDAADAYYFDFKARRDALRTKRARTDDKDLVSAALRLSAAGIDAANRGDVQAMKKEIPQAIASLEELLAHAETEPAGTQTTLKVAGK